MSASWVASRRRAEIAGVPAYLADVPGRAQAALIFRVGWADETLPTHGLTHLVEHLVAGEYGPRAPVSAAIRPCVTMFYAEGEPEEVGEALRAMAGRLGDLPVDRLSAETRVLRVESGEGGASDERGVLLGLRYGARGPGLIAFEQLGLHGATAASVQAHADRWFTRGNAALVATTRIPGLDDLELGDGPLRPARSCPPLAFDHLPAQAPVKDAPMLLGGVFARQPALALLTTMLERWAWRELRQRRGLVYDAKCVTTKVGPRERTLHLTTDATKDDAVHAADLVVRTVAAWADGNIDHDEFRSAQTDVLRRHDEEPMLSLCETAITHLLDDVETPPAERADLLRAVSADDIVALAAHLRDSMLVTVPPDVRPLGLPVLTVSQPAPVTGRRYATRLPADHDDAGEHLIVGAEGVTLTGTPTMTIRYDECVAAVRTLEGALELVGPSGHWLLLDPRYFHDGSGALGEVTRVLDPDLIVERRPLNQVTRLGPALRRLASDRSAAASSATGPTGTIPGLWPERS